jgi:hypothetical protein
MFSKISLAAAALAMTAGALVPVSAADARRHYRGERYSDGYYEGRRDARMRQRCKDGDTGTIIGAIAGGLLGRTVDTRGDRTVGTLVGAGAGALAGRAIDRSDRPEYCRR